MTRYSVQPTGWTFVTGYGFSSFAKNMGKSIGRNISKNLSAKIQPKTFWSYQKIHYRSLKTVLKRPIEKKLESTGDLIVNKKMIRLQRSKQYHHKII